MLGNSTTLTIPMIPGPGQQPNGKRKAMEGAEINPLVAAAKRLKKDVRIPFFLVVVNLGS